MKKYTENEKILDATELDINNNAVSHFETTGLIPAMPYDTDEYSSYHEISNYTQRPITKQEKDNTR